MWQSFLARPQHVLSRLCLVRRPARGGAIPAVIGGRTPYTTGRHREPTQVSAGRTWSDRQGGGCCRGPNQPPQRRRHLYVALDDPRGYALYKLNVDDLFSDDAGAGTVDLHRLPEPVLRLGFRSFGTSARINALGSNIVVTGMAKDTHDKTAGRPRCLTLVYDTKTGRQDIAQLLPDEVDLRDWHETVAVGDKMYAFCPTMPPLYYLGADTQAQPESDDDGDDNEDPDSEDDDEISYLHPDGRTIFMSAVDGHGFGEGTGTYSWDTHQHNGKWTYHGNWHLPFIYQAYYDNALDAWVEFQHSDGADGGIKGYYHLSSCSVPSLGEGTTPRPAWKLCKEPLTFLQAPLSAMCRRLVHIGHGTFCLVEIARRCSCDGHQGNLLRVTMFTASYRKNGKLVATPSGPGRSYLISSSYAPPSTCDPPAFWM
ncbi:hypothetical protein VPH35_139170 [Triticum aestivum]|uniref:DUF295 domain-containing protein n=1 Tax=Aegilops tauschii TaxID=37682 RepID=M8CK56_AEGTA